MLYSFTFEICTVNQLIMKRILTLLVFMLPMLAVAQTQVQTVKGRVFDEASGAPLIGVIVTVTDTKPVRGAVTDSAGYFVIDSILIGRHTFKIAYMSYEDKMLNDIEVTAGKMVNLNIGMQEEVKKLKEVTVTYNRSKDKNATINDMAMVSARSFNADETKRYAGALGDPSRMAANFAGIVAGNDSRNDIVVRGNSPTGMLWQIDGLNAPNPNHFGTLNSTGGPVSMLNNNNIDKSDFLTGAFPAQYGNALAGAFDIRLREGNKEKGEYVAQVGFNGFEGGAEGPIGKNKQTSYLINYRYSTLGVFKTLGLNLGTGTAVPIYQDANYKIVSKLGKKSKLSLFGLAGNSKADFLGKDVDTTKPDLYGGDRNADQKSKFTTTITGLAYDYQVSELTSTKLIVGYSSTDQYYTYDSISTVDRSVYPNQLADFKTGKLSLQWVYQHKFNAKNNIQAGLTYENTNYHTTYKTFSPGTPDNVYEDQKGSLGQEQAYVQWKHRFNKDFSFVGGMHFQYLDMNSSFAAEPRFSFRYAFSSRNAFSIGYGMHSQAQNVYSYFIQTQTPAGTLLTNKDLGFTRSQHIVATYNLNLTQNLRIKAEGYYQAIDKVPVTTLPTSYSALNSGASFYLDNQDYLVNKGTGTNYGAELTVEHFLDKGFYFLITTSLINSRYKGSDGIERNTAFNTGYVANVLAGKEFKVGHSGNVLALNFKVSRIGGRYLTPIDAAASAIAHEAVYEKTKAYSDKQDDYFRVDFKISFKKEYKRSTMEFSLDLQNVTNHQNIFDRNYDKYTNKIISNYQQGFFPVPLFRWTF